MTEGSHEPDLRLDGFGLWGHTREFADEDWLRVTARMKASGAFVETTGPLFRAVEIKSFAEELQKMLGTLSGSAILEGLEPNVRLAFKMTSLGHVDIDLSITPDQLSQSHEFEFGVDQTYLPPLLVGCEAILLRFPPVTS
jgi:hypothetical protein